MYEFKRKRERVPDDIEKSIQRQTLTDFPVYKLVDDSCKINIEGDTVMMINTSTFVNVMTIIGGWVYNDEVYRNPKTHLNVVLTGMFPVIRNYVTNFQQFKQRLLSNDDINESVIKDCEQMLFTSVTHGAIPKIRENVSKLSVYFYEFCDDKLY